MVYNVYCVRDRRLGFLTPIVEVNDEIATRNFFHSVVNSEDVLGSFCTDFSLYCLGQFDNDAGVFISKGLPRFIVSADAAFIHFSTPNPKKAVSKEVSEDG